MIMYVGLVVLTLATIFFYFADRRASKPVATPIAEVRVKPHEAREAREVIRKHLPALALRLDTLFPLEACDHSWTKAEKRVEMYGPSWYTCRGCLERVYQTSGMKAGRAIWSTTPPRKLTKQGMLNSGSAKIGSERDRRGRDEQFQVRYDPHTDSYKTLATRRHFDGTIEAYSNHMSKQLLNIYGIPSDRIGGY